MNSFAQNKGKGEKAMRGKPTTKPPNVIPQYCRAMRGTGPDFIRQYMGFLVYVWTVYGNGFWLYPVGISNGMLYGYIWKNTRYEYTQFRVSLIDCIF